MKKQAGVIVWKNKKPERVFLIKKSKVTDRYGIGGLGENLAVMLGIKSYTMTEDAEGFATDKRVPLLFVAVTERIKNTRYTIW